MSGIRVPYKIMVVGNLASGKTQLIQHFLQRGTFEEDYTPTVGSIALSSKSHPAIGTLYFLDAGSQERFDTFLPAYFRDAYVACVCVAANESDAANLTQLAEWQQKIRLKQSQQLLTKFILVITKADLLDPEVMEAKRQRLAVALGIDPMDIVVCSAATGQGLEELGELNKKIEKDLNLIKLHQDWMPTTTDDAVKVMLTELSTQLKKYENHIKAESQKNKNHSTDNLLQQKQKIVTDLRKHLSNAEQKPLRSINQFQDLNQFSETLQAAAVTLNQRRDPFQNHTEQSLRRLAKILAIAGIGIGLLVTMLVSKIKTGRAYFWRTSGSDMAADMTKSLEKHHLKITPRN